jgi:hypothetical protein
MSAQEQNTSDDIDEIYGPTVLGLFFPRGRTTGGLSNLEVDQCEKVLPSDHPHLLLVTNGA